MSTKKARRRNRQKEEAEGPGRKLSPGIVFILVLAAGLLITVLGVLLFGESPGGDPPFPGAVWSSSHGHWH